MHARPAVSKELAVVTLGGSPARLNNAGGTGAGGGGRIPTTCRCFRSPSVRSWRGRSGAEVGTRRPWGSRVSCVGRERGKGSARALVEASGEVCLGRSSRRAAPKPLREARSPPEAAAGGRGCRMCPRPSATAAGPFSAGLPVRRSPNLVSPPLGVLVARTGRQQLASPARSRCDPGRRGKRPRRGACEGSRVLPAGPSRAAAQRAPPDRGRLPPAAPRARRGWRAPRPRSRQTMGRAGLRARREESCLQTRAFRNNIPSCADGDRGASALFITERFALPVRAARPGPREGLAAPRGQHRCRVSSLKGQGPGSRHAPACAAEGSQRVPSARGPCGKGAGGSAGLGKGSLGPRSRLSPSSLFPKAAGIPLWRRSSARPSWDPR